MSTHAPERPWYKEPYVWLVVLIPASAVGVAGVMIGLAIWSDDGVVIDDYYRRGLEINASLLRDREATRLGLAGHLVIDGQGAPLRLTLSGNAGFAVPQRVTLSLLHATRAQRDRHLMLDRTGPASFTGTTPLALAPGRWYVQLETPAWRLTGTLQVPGERSVDLDAGSPP